MSQQSMFQTPQTVTAELDVSTATLRRWSDEFALYLSPEAGSTPGRSHRRYSDHDIETLHLIKELMSSGLTYEQVRQHLADEQNVWTEQVSRVSPSNNRVDDEQVFDPDENSEKAIIAPNGADASAVDFITTSLATLSENQKSVLNSQAANRELLGVLIQDNFNLKEENNQLRQRLLEVERHLNQIRHEDDWRRESLRQEMDAKIMQVQQTASEALSAALTPQPPPDIKAVQSKPGCLGGLFGGGDIKIISAAGRRGQGQQEPSQLPSYPPTYGPVQPPAAPPAQSPPSHPKPMAPPE